LKLPADQSTPIVRQEKAHAAELLEKFGAFEAQSFLSICRSAHLKSEWEEETKTS
jgi:hypothetical protein